MKSMQQKVFCEIGDIARMEVMCPRKGKARGQSESDRARPKCWPWGHLGAGLKAVMRVMALLVVG